LWGRDYYDQLKPKIFFTFSLKYFCQIFVAGKKQKDFQLLWISFFDRFGKLFWQEVTYPPFPM
jgi:hypothetical protein